MQNEKVYKTPIYIRNAMRAYINRQKEKDIDLYNESRNEYYQIRYLKYIAAGRFTEKNALNNK